MLSDALQRRWNRRSCGNLSAIFVVNIGWTPVQEISLLQYISVSFPPIFYQTRLLSRLSNLFYCQYHECTYKLHSISCKGHVTCRRGFFIDGHFDCKLYTESVDIFCWHQIWWLVTKTTVHLSSKYLSIIRLLARVLKEGVQFRYNDTSTVKGGGGGGGGGCRENVPLENLWSLRYFMSVFVPSSFEIFQTHLALWVCAAMLLYLWHFHSARYTIKLIKLSNV
jgi:hypothetical protein